MLHSSGLAQSDVMQAATPAAPIAGGTVAITNTGLSGLTVINPAGTLATLTINLPADASSRIGQIERIAFLKSITLLTIAGASSILGAPTAAALGDNIGFQKGSRQPVDASDMKKILFALMLALSASAFSQVMPNDVTVRQRRADDTGYLDRFVSFPSGGASCLFSLDGPSVLPNCYQIGTGLNLASGILSVSAGGGQMQADWTQANTLAVDYIKNKPALFSGAYADLTGKPSIPAAQISSDWAASSGVSQILNKPSLAAVATSGSYSDLTNKPTIPTVTAFNFSLPTGRSLAVSTSYQALDNTKAAVIVPSYACQNATTVLAASACTIQVRMGTGTLTCSTGTVYYTQSLTVQLGVLITQNSTNPVQINLPIGGSFIICPQAGTFTISAVEQSAG